MSDSIGYIDRKCRVYRLTKRFATIIIPSGYLTYLRWRICVLCRKNNSVFWHTSIDVVCFQPLGIFGSIISINGKRLLVDYWPINVLPGYKNGAKYHLARRTVI